MGSSRHGSLMERSGFDAGSPGPPRAWPVPGTGQVRVFRSPRVLGRRLAAGDCGDDSDRLFAAERGFDPVAASDILAVDVDVHERSQLATLVEEEVTHWKSFERAANRGRVDFE